MKYEWAKNGADYRCELPGNITLVVTPMHYAKGFTPKAARGTKWHAQASHWDAASSCMSRYGRDEYMNPVASAKDAMKLAQSIYEEATRWIATDAWAQPEDEIVSPDHGQRVAP